MPKLFHKKGFIRAMAGFTLVELLVVIVIMSLITLAFVNNQSKFDSSTIVRSLAYSVALSIRQTQVYGTSVVQNSPGSSLFGPVYGVSFGASPTRYFIFSDSTSPAVGEYDPGVPATPMKKFDINNEYAIQEVCAVTNDTPAKWRCSGTDDTSGAQSISVLDVMFMRPNPDARINVFHPDKSTIAGDSYIAAYIQLRAINSDVRVIKVTLTGQITVCQGVGNINSSPSASNLTIASIKANLVTC